MASTSFVEVAHTTLPPPASGSHANSLAHSRNKSKSGPSSKSNEVSGGHENTVLHAHRQNHNSSKLPAFRFADLMSKKDGLVAPSLLQHIPPSPVSPPNPTNSSTAPTEPDNQVGRTLGDVHNRSQRTHASEPNNIHKNNNLAENRVETADPESNTSKSPQSSPSRNRASTFQPSSISTPLSVTTSKRPLSLPDSPSAAVTPRIDATASQSSTATSPTAKTQHRRAAGSDTSRPPPSLNSRRLQAVESAQEVLPADSSTKEWAQGQRELLLPKTIESSKSDEKKKSRPPVSFRPPSIANVSASRPVIPPIRSFRSSGSRKSLVLDMHARRVSDDSTYGEDITDPNVRDRTLRALEGRGEEDYSQITPPDSAAYATPDQDNTADLFMRIAHQDATRRAPEDHGMTEDRSTVSRIARSSHRRPLSAAVPPSQITSPPQISRRLSDQRENSRARASTDGQSAQQLTRELNYRAIVKDKSRPPITTDTQSVRSPLRPSPITPRQITFQEEALQGISAYSRRRGSLTESNSGMPSRVSQYRSANVTYGPGKTYNSSPLVPKAAEPHRQEGQHGPEGTHGVEGTESSASTAAPSTVWDELDDLKSRIHRLELTGKAPPSSAAAMSRVSDDRPPTANTNATTMSTSPKRTSGNAADKADAASTVSSQRDSQPVLLSALSKTKDVIGIEAFTAIESAATDAMALAQMMGTPGQPGPISSGASTIGAGGSLTDRQLRRKVESICRSLTELCLALAEENMQAKQQQPAAPAPQKETPPSPVITRFPGFAAQRRGSALAEQSLVRANTSPRTPTTLEQRRFSMMTSSALPSPRYALAPSAAGEGAPAGRKSSLLISRARRAATEEPEEQPTGRKSSLLRTRRAGTEEPEENREGRKTSFLVRNRKGANGEEEDETRFRVPSRAVTEVNGVRPSREISQGQTSPPDPNSAGSPTALPRRRLVPSSLNSRLIPPQSPSAVGSRRYLERATPERDTSSVAEKLAEDRGQRQLSLSQTAMLNRTSSITRRRDSAIPSLASPSTQTSSYR